MWIGFGIFVLVLFLLALALVSQIEPSGTKPVVNDSESHNYNNDGYVKRRLD
jgi:hypothetical protein